MPMPTWIVFLIASVNVDRRSHRMNNTRPFDAAIDCYVRNQSPLFCVIIVVLGD